jgi:hypothetical protein
MSGIHHAVHIEKQTISERCIFSPLPGGVFKIRGVHHLA